ncbi:MAG: TfoX/Sxy family protein [Desulfobacterales bacterium]|nr:TfoX/Sxy family protein [Desulfobacterales bacterium]MDJ0874629.1 TfoX/Sxy family protein [Desulfobacterales bacterium]MDJ0884821.1 TfoX/Sxy family protein [Desulfobacterales bacterium]
MAYSKQLAQRIDAIVRDLGLTKKGMFGGICYLRQGNMCFGVYKDYLIVRLGSAEAAEPYLAQEHVGPMDITGRPMKGWIMVAPAACRSEARLKDWLQLGDRFARSLPPKPDRTR